MKTNFKISLFVIVLLSLTVFSKSISASVIDSYNSGISFLTKHTSANNVMLGI